MTLNINKFQFNNKEPIYLQIVELVKKNIAIGDLSPGDKLPSVRELSKDLGVNANRLRGAYGELERLGITYTRRGMGSFISEGDNSMKDLKVDMGKDLAKKFIKEMASIGIDKEEAIKILKSLEE